MRDLDRREFLAGVAAGGRRRPRRAETGLHDAAAASAGGLAEPAFRPLPLGAIRPAGWLPRQLRIQADGLTGHLDEFWPDVGAEPVVRRHGRGLGARALLARRRHPARVASSTTRRSRPASPATSTTSSPTSARTAGTARTPRTPSRSGTTCGRSCSRTRRSSQYHEATGDARVLEAVVKSLRALLAGLDRTPLYEWGQLPLVRGPRVGVLRLRAHARAVAARPRAQAAGAGRRLRGALPRPTTSPCRRRGAASGSGPSTSSTRRWPPRRRPCRWRLDQRPADRAFATRDDRDPRPAPRPGDRHVLRRRVPGRPEPAAGDRAVRGGRVHVLARAPVLRLRRPVLRRPARAGGLQRAAGDVRARHVVAPVRPAGQPGAVHGQPRPPVDHERPRVEPLRPRAELRLLHREHAPGLAEARRAPVDEDAGRGARGRGLGAQPRGVHRRAACPSPCRVDTDYPFRETLAITVRPERAGALPARAARAGVGGGRDGDRVGGGPRSR